MKELEKLIAPMEEAFAKLPPLPKGVKDFIVTILPWLALIFGLLGVLVALAALGILTFLAPLAAIGNVNQTTALTIGLILGMISSVVTLVSFPGLLSKKITGWNLIFLSVVVGVISSIEAIFIVGIIVSLIEFYILFQIKSYYK